MGRGGREGSQEAVGGLTRVATLYLLARSLNEFVVLHPRRAGGHAGHTPQALVEVLYGRRGEVEPPFIPRLHQVDAPAWQIHFLTPQEVGRTGRQAETAMRTLVNKCGIGRVVRVKSTPFDFGFMSRRRTLLDFGLVGGGS